MFRSYDWECEDCEQVAWHLIDVPAGDFIPEVAIFDCEVCDGPRNHKRRVSLIAPYCGEKVLNPMVAGGSFDTMGHEKLPELPGQSSGKVDWQEFRETAHTKEFNEVYKERQAITERNKAKRKRAEAIKRGENINMRTTRLAGDPKITS